jgi:hypothetical protein
MKIEIEVPAIPAEPPRKEIFQNESDTLAMIAQVSSGQFGIFCLERIEKVAWSLNRFDTKVFSSFQSARSYILEKGYAALPEGTQIKLTF